ncbi:MAG: tail fiber domain-containing protein [Chitinophagales bacterium]
MKKITLITFILICLLSENIFGQTNTFPSSGSAGIGTLAPNSSSLLEMVSTSKGILIPRMTKAQRNAIATPATGLLIYQTNAGPGFYYYSGTAWTAVSGSGNDWKLTGNSGTDTSINFIGTIDNTPLVFVIDNTRSGFIDNGTSGTAFGYRSLFKNGGNNNVAFGRETMSNNTSGYRNSAVGMYALYKNTSGWDNTVIGYEAMYNNTTGNFNTAIGQGALYSNTDGFENIAIGDDALRYNTTGALNVAIGNSSMQENLTGINNSGMGNGTLFYNTTGNDNTASGFGALYYNTIGYSNAADGVGALNHNTTGYENTASGGLALNTNTSGGQNTGIGFGSGSYNDANTYCTFIGYDADQTVSTDFTNSTALGKTARITASNQVRIGNTSVTSIGGYQNWSNISDGRYKKNVNENVKGLEFISKLRPVTYTMDVSGLNTFFKYDEKTIDNNAVAEKEKIIYSGFIAQEVEAAAKQVSYDFSGIDYPENENDLYGLRYAEFVVPLVKAVQELDAENQELREQNYRLQEQINKLNESVFGNSIQQINDDENFLGQNIPNPFDHSTTINYSVKQNSNNASLQISELSTGKLVKTVALQIDGTQVILDSDYLAAGVYLYTLVVDGAAVESHQMVISK